MLGLSGDVAVHVQANIAQQLYAYTTSACLPVPPPYLSRLGTVQATLKANKPTSASGTCAAQAIERAAEDGWRPRRTGPGTTRWAVDVTPLVCPQVFSKQNCCWPQTLLARLASCQR